MTFHSLHDTLRNMWSESLIRKSDLPKKDYSCKNIFYSLSKAINNHRYGNYMDCHFPNENTFKDFLDALVLKNVIKEKTIKAYSGVNLGNYIYIGNIDFNNKKSAWKWFVDNVIPFFSIGLSIVPLVF